MSMARLTPAVFGASLRLIQSLLFIHFVLLSLGISTLSKTDSGFKLSVLEYTIYDPPRVKVIQGRTPQYTLDSVKCRKLTKFKTYG